jgi:hypothetical protein
LESVGSVVDSSGVGIESLESVGSVAGSSGIGKESLESVSSVIVSSGICLKRIAADCCIGANRACALTNGNAVDQRVTIDLKQVAINK